jgi:hypothetical protein
MEPQPSAKPNDISDGRSIIRYTIAVVVVLIICIYVVAVVLGRIPAQQKVGVAEITLIVVAAVVVSVLLRPELLDRLTHLKFGGVELDWLQKLQEDQKKQRDELDAVRFVLTLLLKPQERQHLSNLEAGRTQYQGNDTLCAELRNLRTLGLIQNRNDRTIGEIARMRNFDLKDIVELTVRGRYYLERLGEQREAN